jgi:hypothetical protein
MADNQRKFEPVIEGGKLNRKSETQRCAESIFYNIMHDVVIPSVKKMADEMFHSLLYPGEPRRGDNRQSNIQRTSYRRYYGTEDDSRSGRGSDAYYYDAVSYGSRGEAELVLDRMLEAIDEYGRVSVLDMYDMSDIDPERIPHTANNYGWSDLRTARVVRSYNGDYIIKLPRALPFN